MIAFAAAYRSVMPDIAIPLMKYRCPRHLWRRSVGCGQQLEEFQALHARQPGYQSTIVVDAGDGRSLVVNLWESEEHANAALGEMVPAVRRLLEPITVAPSEVLGAGRVVLTNLERR